MEGSVTSDSASNRTLEVLKVAQTEGVALSTAASNRTLEVLKVVSSIALVVLAVLF